MPYNLTPRIRFNGAKVISLATADDRSPLPSWPIYLAASQREGRIASTSRSVYSGLTDVPGIKVGHSHAAGAPDRVHRHPRGGGRRRRRGRSGSAPGTIETDLLNPVNLVQEVHAVFSLRRQCVWARRGHRRPPIPVRATDRIRDAGRESADRSGRHHLRSWRGRPAGDLARCRLRVSRRERGDRREGRGR